MSVELVSDERIVDLYRGRWVPAAGHFHGPGLWAMWDGQQIRYGLQPGVAEVPAAVVALDAEFAAFVMGLTLPTLPELLARGMEAFGRWVAAGLPIVSEELRQERGKICQQCPFWDGAARWGLGSCNHAACGCTQLKWWLRTERCPAGKWPA